MTVIPSILVADGEAAIRQLITLRLRTSGLQARAVRTGAEAVAAIAAWQPLDLLILDAALPVMNGCEALHHIRALTAVPVIMLTTSAQDAERIALLRDGADDCLTKPFNPHELAARVLAVLRRTTDSGSATGNRLVYHGLVLDLARRRVERDGTEVRLSRTEWDVLGALAADAGRVVERRLLLRAVWGGEYVEEGRSLHTWVARLRRKLGEELPLETLPGIGYRLGASETG